VRRTLLVVAEVRSMRMKKGGIVSQSPIPVLLYSGEATTAVLEAQPENMRIYEKTCTIERFKRKHPPN
jgi:hypothetical protein